MRFQFLLQTKLNFGTSLSMLLKGEAKQGSHPGIIVLDKTSHFKNLRPNWAKEAKVGLVKLKTDLLIELWSRNVCFRRLVANERRHLRANGFTHIAVTGAALVCIRINTNFRESATFILSPGISLPYYFMERMSLLVARARLIRASSSAREYVDPIDLHFAAGKSYIVVFRV